MLCLNCYYYIRKECQYATLAPPSDPRLVACYCSILTELCVLTLTIFDAIQNEMRWKCCISGKNTRLM